MTKWRNLVDPELLIGLDLRPAFDIDANNLAEVRQAMAQMVVAADQLESVGTTWFEASVPQVGHAIPVRVYVPGSSASAGGKKSAGGAVLHIHGGGYVLGSAAMGHAQNMALAADIGAVVVSVDYRLAPEYPAPASLEDCYSTLCWMAETAGELGFDPSRIAVRGESAGGGLAAALAQMARDRGGPSIVHQNLIYPMLDDRTCITVQPEHFGAFTGPPKSNMFGWQALLGSAPGAVIAPDYAVPARTHDLSGLPSAFIGVGALDLFLREDMDYAQRLAEAGVPTELHVYPGAYHGFNVVAEASVSLRLKRDATTALRAALSSSAEVGVA